MDATSKIIADRVKTHVELGFHVEVGGTYHSRCPRSVFDRPRGVYVPDPPWHGSTKKEIIRLSIHYLQIPRVARISFV